MLARSISSRTFVQSRLAPQLASAAAVRRLSMAARPSAIALGKRPSMPQRSAVLSLAGVNSARFISFGGSSSNGTESVNAATQAAAAAPVAEPAAAASASAAGASEPLPIDTPVLSSDMPALPAEAGHASGVVDHLTTAAPTHQFESAVPTLHDLLTKSNLPLEDVLNSPEAVHATMTVADLKTLGLDHNLINIAGWLRDSLVGMHNLTDLPWWASIIALTMVVRLAISPKVVDNLKHNVRLQAVSPQMQALSKRFSEASKAGDKQTAAIAQQHLQQLLKENDVSPFRPLMMPLIQMPFFLGMFYALRKLADLPLPQLKDGGFSWITDLTVPDPYYILPVTSILLQLLVLRVGIDGTGTSASSQRTSAHLRNGLMALSPVFVAVTSQFPAAVLFYWTGNNLFSLTQAFLLQRPFVKRILNIPPPPPVIAPPPGSEVDPNPSFKDTWTAFRETVTNTHKSVLEQASTAAAAKGAADSARVEAGRGSTPGTHRLGQERIVEPQRGSAAGGFLESPSPSSSSSSSPTGAPATAAERRARRVADARSRRNNAQ